MTTSRMESQSTSTATSMNTWQRNVGQKRKNEKQGNVSNAAKKSTQPKTVKEYNQ